MQNQLPPLTTTEFEPVSLRETVLRMAYNAQCVHIPCAFSIIELLSALYGNLLRFDRADPRNPKRDYLVLSKGHGVMAQYACFYRLGWITDNDVNYYLGNGTNLHGLSESHIPGCEVTSGSLGHGLPIAVGIAKGLAIKGSDQKVFCIVGDGELNEGSAWESILFAAHHKLRNLNIIVDANGFQAMGETSQIINLESLTQKFSSFGFFSDECNGHEVKNIIEKIRAMDGEPLPKSLIARTIKGKGVSFMENNNSWHYTRLNQNTYQAALRELGGA